MPPLENGAPILNMPPSLNNIINSNFNSGYINISTANRNIRRNLPFGFNPQNITTDSSGNNINQGPMEFLNTLNNLLNMVHLPQEEMEDVKVTLDEEDFSNIKTETLQEDMEGSCSICMMNFIKGNEVSTLPCKHYFHTDCINQWLKEYNYKCPVCRKECGKPKYNV